LADPAIWYEANAVCGDELVRLGAVLLVVGVSLTFLRDLPELGYVTICLAVFVVGSTRAVLRGWRLANRLRQQREPGSAGASAS
jgi:hypothetical protein